MEIVKRWGSERVLFYGPYLVKELVIHAGKATSMHFHNCKTETIVVLDGVLRVDFEEPCPIQVNGQEQDSKGEEFILGEGETMTIFEGLKSAHSMRSLKGARYIEASTPHRVDSERLYLCDDWRPR